MEVAEKLVGKFQFASGVAVVEATESLDDNFVLVAERSHARIRKVEVGKKTTDGDNVKESAQKFKKSSWLSKLPCHPTSLQVTRILRLSFTLCSWCC